jgi:hypothetical protein
MKNQTDLGIFIKLDHGGWIRRIYVCSKNDEDTEIIIRAMSRILKRSCQSWVKRLMTRAGAAF